MIYDSSIYETKDAAALREVINKAEVNEYERLKAHNLVMGEMRQMYADMLLAQRPAYPTAEHLTGITKVARMVHDGTKHGDHLGHPREGEDRLPRGVLFQGGVNRVNIYARAPYDPVRRSGGRLWSFTEDEVAALRGCLETEGLIVVSQWTHDDGVAFIVAANADKAKGIRRRA